MYTTDLFELDDKMAQQLDQQLYFVVMDRMRFGDFLTARNCMEFCQSFRRVKFPKTISITSVANLLDQMLTKEQKEIIKAEKPSIPIACMYATDALYEIVKYIIHSDGDYKKELIRTSWLEPLLANCLIVNTRCGFEIFSYSAVDAMHNVVNQRKEQLEKWIEEGEQKKAAKS